MTRKHFAAVAADLKAQRDSYDPESEALEILVVEETARRLAGTFASFNANFNRSRFLTACGL